MFTSNILIVLKQNLAVERVELLDDHDFPSLKLQPTSELSLHS